MNRVESPTVQYCIEAYLPGQKLAVERFTIEQFESNTRDKKSEDRVYNQVQRHLSALSIKTGLNYSIVRWGDPQDRTAWIQGAPFDD